jgi:hypothetical protein
MTLSRDRIPVQGSTPHVHEQRAIEYLLGALPDQDPYRAWVLFDLVDRNGRRYEMDALVITPHGLYHVEIKSHPGKLRGDVVDWHHTFPEGRTITVESPMGVAERKSKVLGDMLQKEMGRERPFVETLLFLSEIAPSDVELAGPARMHVVTKPELRRALTLGEFAGSEGARRTVITPQFGKKIGRRCRRSVCERPPHRRRWDRTRSTTCSKTASATRIGRRTTSDCPTSRAAFGATWSRKRRPPSTRTCSAARPSVKRAFSPPSATTRTS